MKLRLQDKLTTGSGARHISGGDCGQLGVRETENVCNPAGEVSISSLVTDTVAEWSSGHKKVPAERHEDRCSACRIR